MTERTVLKIGDCYLIPLPDGRYAYGQYVYLNDHRPDGLGALVQIFDLITPAPVPIERLQTAGPLFPAVFVGLRASVRSGRWRLMGRLPVKDFKFPKFRVTNGHGPGMHEWWIWDGKTTTFVGHLPPELRRLEVKTVWGDELLEARIATGKNHHELMR